MECHEVVTVTEVKIANMIIFLMEKQGNSNNQKEPENTPTLAAILTLGKKK